MNSETPLTHDCHCKEAPIYNEPSTYVNLRFRINGNSLSSLSQIQEILKSLEGLGLTVAGLNVDTY